MTLQAVRGPSGAQIAFTILLGTSIGDTVTQCTAHDKGVANTVTVGQNNFFLENKAVINFDFQEWSQKIRSFGPHITEFRLSLNLAGKEQNERVYKCGRECNFFCRECIFSSS